jgi:hypothetical protein
MSQPTNTRNDDATTAPPTAPSAENTATGAAMAPSQGESKTSSGNSSKKNYGMHPDQEKVYFDVNLKRDYEKVEYLVSADNEEEARENWMNGTELYHDWDCDEEIVNIEKLFHRPQEDVAKLQEKKVGKNVWKIRTMFGSKNFVHERKAVWKVLVKREGVHLTNCVLARCKQEAEDIWHEGDETSHDYDHVYVEEVEGPFQTTDINTTPFLNTIGKMEKVSEVDDLFNITNTVEKFKANFFKNQEEIRSQVALFETRFKKDAAALNDNPLFNWTRELFMDAMNSCATHWIDEEGKDAFEKIPSMTSPFLQILDGLFKDDEYIADHFPYIAELHEVESKGEVAELIQLLRSLRLIKN